MSTAAQHFFRPLVLPASPLSQKPLSQTILSRRRRRRQGQLGACYLMPRTAPNVRNPKRAIWAICTALPCPHPDSDGHPEPTPYPFAVPARRQPRTHTTHILTTTPTPKPHQFPAELAQEAVKASAVHVGAGAVSSAITRKSRAEWAGSARQRRPHPCLTPRLLALGSSRRCRPNIWQPRPAPPPAPQPMEAGRAGDALPPSAPPSSPARLRSGTVAPRETGLRLRTP